ncbi:uncharacterized protein LOC142354906 [Convolutriloba macropyga]|uniref:uncharacterized protein LOC142354906 n=1 Tax=Convolutriloba macropyga TaxID=536237 RepID=UPI003F524E33
MAEPLDSEFKKTRKFTAVLGNEEIPTTTQWTSDEQKCEDHFKGTTRRNSAGRFVVKIPFKEDAKSMSDSYQQAKRRLGSLIFRLENNQIYTTDIEELKGVLLVKTRFNHAWLDPLNIEETGIACLQEYWVLQGAYSDREYGFVSLLDHQYKISMKLDQGLIMSQSSPFVLVAARTKFTYDGIRMSPEGVVQIYRFYGAFGEIAINMTKTGGFQGVFLNKEGRMMATNESQCDDDQVIDAVPVSSGMIYNATCGARVPLFRGSYWGFNVDGYKINKPSSFATGLLVPVDSRIKLFLFPLTRSSCFVSDNTT